MGASRKNILKRLSDGLAYIEDFSLGIILIVIVALIFGNVFSRFILGKPYAWPDEIAKFLHVIGIYIGVAVASRKNTHLKIDLVPQYFPGTKKAYGVIAPIGGVIFSTIFVCLSYQFFAFERMMLDRSWVTSVPIWVIALVILISGIMIFIREVERLINSVFSLRAKPEKSEI